MNPIISKKFYFIRHAQTDANANEQMCGGDWDVPLNETGLEQVRGAKEKLNLLEAKIQRIFVSPMLRTRKTAEILNEGVELPIEVRDGLREWCVGDWEKQPWSEVPNPFNTTEDPPNGETREYFEERVVKTVNECLKASDEETVLIVAHGAVAHTLFTFMGVDTPHIKNATYYELSPREKHWHLKEII